MAYSRWSDYERAADYGPGPIVAKAILFSVGLFVALGLFGYACGWFTEAGQVAQEQFGARAMLEKYEWFKDASAALDAKLASIQVYEKRFADMKTSYGDTPRSQWSRDDREQWNLWTSEIAGITASYNTLAADYNAQMAKFNYRFANVGELPQGAATPLPREYKPYQTGDR